MLDNLGEVVLKLLVLNDTAIPFVHEPKTELVPLFLAPIAQDVHDPDERLKDELVIAPLIAHKDFKYTVRQKWVLILPKQAHYLPELLLRHNLDPLLIARTVLGKRNKQILLLRL